MAESNDWLVGLKGQIIDAKDTVNFEDIIKCYQAGLYRAGFLLAWVMLVESLKRKIVDLADREVKVAIQELAKINKQEAAMHSNDEYIWNGAATCDLISAEEKSVVEMLWGKRCIMSHPYMPEVRECDFRYMVENLVSMSLAKPLMWSHSMIDAYFEDIAANTFLIPDTMSEKREAADKLLALIPSKNRPFFWKTLFFQYSLASESGPKKLRIMLSVLAMKFVLLTDVDINDVQYTLASQIKKNCAACWGIFYTESIWDKLNEDFHGQMFRFLKDNKKEGRKALQFAKYLVEKNESLKEEYVNCYYDALAQYDVTDMEHYYVNKARFLKKLYDDKIAGYQFYDQGEFIDMLESMTEESISNYTPKQCQKIGRWVEFCCMTGTFKAQNFAKSSNDWTKNGDYIKGFVLEGITDENGSLYPTRRHMEYVLPVLYHATVKYRKAALEAIAELPIGKTCSEELISKSLRGMVRQYFEDDTEESKALNEILDKYCKA